MTIKNLEIGEVVFLRNGTISTKNNIPKFWELSKQNDKQVVYYFGGGIAFCPVGKIAEKHPRAAADIEVYGEYTINEKGFICFNVCENGTQCLWTETYDGRTSFTSKEAILKRNKNEHPHSGCKGNLIWAIYPKRDMSFLK